MSTRDELAGVLADTINKQFKDMKVAYFLDGTDTTPTDIKDFVSTGSKDDYRLGKKIEAKMRTYAPVVVRGEESQGVKFGVLVRRFIKSYYPL